ncbi:MAG: putative immunity protein [Methylocystaceae bacterium]
MPKARKMLSDWDAPYIQSLVKLIETQSKTTLVIWAVGYAERVILPLWSKHYPDDLRPQTALNAAHKWLVGAIKLPPAKATILECHAAARETPANPVAQAAARAIGQSASTIHSARHCVGLALYGAIAVAYDTLGMNASWEHLEQCAAEECGRMLDALRALAVENEPNPAKIDWKC